MSMLLLFTSLKLVECVSLKELLVQDLYCAKRGETV